MLISFIAFTGTVGLLTWLMTRKDNHATSDGFFLGGRSLTFPVIAGSLLLTNLSTEQLIGLNGAAPRDEKLTPPSGIKETSTETNGVRH
jgi:SSS family solute:Na+ symporter